MFINIWKRLKTFVNVHNLATLNLLKWIIRQFSVTRTKLAFLVICWFLCYTIYRVVLYYFYESKIKKKPQRRWLVTIWVTNLYMNTRLINIYHRVQVGLCRCGLHGFQFRRMELPNSGGISPSLSPHGIPYMGPQ